MTLSWFSLNNPWCHSGHHMADPDVSSVGCSMLSGNKLWALLLEDDYHSSDTPIQYHKSCWLYSLNNPKFHTSHNLTL